MHYCDQTFHSHVGLTLSLFIERTPRARYRSRYMQPSAIADWIDVARSLLSGINAINAPTYRPDISSIQDRARPVRVCKSATGHVKHRVNIGTLLTRKLRSARINMRPDACDLRESWRTAASAWHCGFFNEFVCRDNCLHTRKPQFPSC